MKIPNFEQLFAMSDREMLQKLGYSESFLDEMTDLECEKELSSLVNHPDYLKRIKDGEEL